MIYFEGLWRQMAISDLGNFIVAICFLVAQGQLEYSPNASFRAADLANALSIFAIFLCLKQVKTEANAKKEYRHASFDPRYPTGRKQLSVYYSAIAALVILFVILELARVSPKIQTIGLSLFSVGLFYIPFILLRAAHCWKEIYKIHREPGSAAEMAAIRDERSTPTIPDKRLQNKMAYLIFDYYFIMNLSSNLMSMAVLVLLTKATRGAVITTAITTALSQLSARVAFYPSLPEKVYNRPMELTLRFFSSLLLMGGACVTAFVGQDYYKLTSWIMFGGYLTATLAPVLGMNCYRSDELQLP